jgi:hypothetical protein
VIGLPGGTRSFSAVSVRTVRYVSQLADNGKLGLALRSTAANGVDRGLGFARSGANNGWTRSTLHGLERALPSQSRRYVVRARLGSTPQRTIPADQVGLGVHAGTQDLASGTYGTGAGTGTG